MQFNKIKYYVDLYKNGRQKYVSTVLLKKIILILKLIFILTNNTYLS